MKQIKLNTFKDKPNIIGEKVILSMSIFCYRSIVMSLCDTILGHDKVLRKLELELDLEWLTNVNEIDRAIKHHCEICMKDLSALDHIVKNRYNLIDLFHERFIIESDYRKLKLLIGKIERYYNDEIVKFKNLIPEGK